MYEDNYEEYAESDNVKTPWWENVLYAVESLSGSAAAVIGATKGTPTATTTSTGTVLTGSAASNVTQKDTSKNWVTWVIVAVIVIVIAVLLWFLFKNKSN